MSNFNPEQLLPSELQGQKPNDTGSLTINTQAKNKLIKLLTNLYHNPITATVREIISNAIDATKLLPASQRQPIDIHLPSEQELFFAVTDHANGMSPQEVKNIYLNYGTSTKDHNPQQIGSYGLGAKAPLSYTQTFVVTTVKDQQETTCVINLQQVQLYITKSSAANGTRVKIPLSNDWDIHDFYAAVATYAVMPLPGIQFTGLQSVQKEFYPYGEVIPCGTIQVAQKKLSVYWRYTAFLDRMSKHFFNGFSWLYRELHDNGDRDLDSLFTISAVLGGFEYPLSSPQNQYLPEDEFIIELQPGIVNFSSSRDEIVPDAKKQQLLESFCEQISTSFMNTIKTVGLRNLVNAEMFPLAVRACADYYLLHPELVSADPTLIKQIFTNQQHINLWEVTPRPLALLDLQDDQKSEIEFKLTNVHNRKELLNVVKTRFDDPQQRPSLFKIRFSRYFEDQEAWNWDEKLWDKLCQEGVINVFTDLNDFNLVKKVFRKRKKIIQATQKHVSSTNTNLPNILLLFQEPRAQVQPVVEQILAGIPVTINYFSRSETEQLLDHFQPVRKNLPQALRPFRTQIINNAFDFYQLCCNSKYTKNFVPAAVNLTLGLIVDNRPATEIITNCGEEILKIIFLFQAKINLQVNLYRAVTLKGYNMKQIQQQNDWVLCLHDFTRKNIQYYVSKFNIPARKITLSNQTQDLLLLLLYWSQILGQQQPDPTDYHAIRLILEKLLQLHLLRHDPPLLNLLMKNTLLGAYDIDIDTNIDVRHSYQPLVQILDEFEPLYQVFNNTLQTGRLPVQSVNPTPVQADIKLIKQYWQKVQEQELHHNSAPLLDFNSYIVHSYLTK